MNKKILIVGIIIGIILLVVWLMSRGENIFFEEPNGWEKITWEKTVFTGEISYQNPFDSKTFIEFMPEKTKEQNFKIDNIWENITISSKAICNNYEIIQKSNFTINDIQSYDYIDVCELKYFTDKRRFVVITKDNKFIFLYLYTTKEKFDENNIIFNKMLNSIVWK